MTLSGDAYRNAADIWIDPGDVAYDDTLIGGPPIGPSTAPIVYLFCTDPSGDGRCVAVSEDGHILKRAWCSHPGYMRHDLYERDDNGAAMRAHHPHGYRLQILDVGQLPPDEVLHRSEELYRNAEASNG